jgi:hypothetical protein
LFAITCRSTGAMEDHMRAVKLSKWHWAAGALFLG